MVLKALALVAALTVTPATLSQAADADCIPVEVIKADLVDKGLPSTEYTGAMAKSLIAAIAEVLGPAPSDNVLQADLLIAVKYNEMIFVGFIADGCYIGRAILTVQTWNQIIGHAS